MKRLSGMDAMFLHTETATQYMHSLKVAIFDPPQDGTPYSFADQLAHIGSTVHRVPPFRWKAVFAPLNIHHPLWINDPHFDLGLHVHRAALPAPGGEAELCEFIENIASAPLNRDRPLWELWMVENYLGNKVAAVAKVHHAIADGMATAELLEDLMTAAPGQDISTAEPYHPEQAPGWWMSLGWALWDLVRDLIRIPRQIGQIRAAKQRQKARNLPAEDAPPPAYTSPHSLLNEPISSHRKYNFFTLPLAEAKAVSKAFGVSLNDLVLDMVAQTVRDYLLARDALPEASLTATVPVSTRGEETVHTYGNHVAAFAVSLCTETADIVERLHRIHQKVVASKLDYEDMRGGSISDIVGLLPPAAVRAIGRYSRRLSEQGGSPSHNIIVSNVPGPKGSLYDDTMPLREFYSIGPVLEGIGLNVTAWSFGDKLSFSILSCIRAVPDPGEIRQGLLAAFEQLQEAASVRGDPGGDRGEGQGPL